MSDELYEKIEIGDENAVRQLIKAGEDVNQIQQYHGTPLCQAIMYGHPPIIDLLLSAGADPNIPTPYDGSTPLITFSNTGLRSESMDGAMRAIIAAGADLRAVDKKDENVLIHLANSDSSETEYLVPTLIEAGIDVNYRSKGGWTALHTAIFRNRSNLVKLLIEAGADISERTDRGTALHDAADYDRAEIARMLLAAGIDPEIKDKDGETAKNIAVRLFRPKIYSVLSGGQILGEREIRDRHGDWLATLYVELRAVLDQEKGEERENERSEQLFVDLVKRHGEKCLRLKFDDDIMDPVLRGNTLTHTAVQKFYVTGTKEILKHNPDLTVTNSAGLMAVELAYNFLLNGSGELVTEENSTGVGKEAWKVYKLLLAASPQVYEADAELNKETIIDESAQPELKDSEQFQTNEIAAQSLEDQLIAAVVAEDGGKIEKLVEAGADCSARMHDGRPLLTYAAANGLLRVANLLLWGGADLSVEHEGDTPVHAADAAMQATPRDTEEDLERFNRISDVHKLLLKAMLYPDSIQHYQPAQSAKLEATPAQADPPKEDWESAHNRLWKEIWANFGAETFSFEAYRALGHDQDDANEALTFMKETGIIETVGLRQFACIRPYGVDPAPQSAPETTPNVEPAPVIENLKPKLAKTQTSPPILRAESSSECPARPWWKFWA